MGHKNEVSRYHAVMNSYFDCDNIGDLKEYVGCKIDKQERGNHLLITQTGIVRSFIDEFRIQEEKKSKYQPQDAIHSVQFWTEMSSTRKIKRVSIWCWQVAVLVQMVSFRNFKHYEKIIMLFYEGKSSLHESHEESDVILREHKRKWNFN
jgi:hypothetical protein